MREFLDVPRESIGTKFEIKIATDDPPPERYRWQICKIGDRAPIEFAAVSFRREQTAREAGQRALTRFLKEIGKWARV